ncbi:MULTISPECIES: hypothetical protein [unclassified Mycobacterium]|uniref:hypothetical protein n=1 Tax=unclassified Mycobacterium TaxID=2642494 RepID=UPI0012EAB3FB|nr:MULTISPECIES: hypothetical protein [unclassified Mycobacterium]
MAFAPITRVRVRASMEATYQAGGHMADPLEHFERRLVERVRHIIDDHRAGNPGPDGTSPCSCGAEGVSDHSRHVAEEIVEGLAVKPHVDDVKKRIRYATAWLDWELTLLEGAEC